MNETLLLLFVFEWQSGIHAFFVIRIGNQWHLLAVSVGEEGDTCSDAEFLLLEKSNQEIPVFNDCQFIMHHKII